MQALHAAGLGQSLTFEAPGMDCMTRHVEEDLFEMEQLLLHLVDLG